MNKQVRIWSTGVQWITEYASVTVHFYISNCDACNTRQCLNFRNHCKTSVDVCLRIQRFCSWRGLQDCTPGAAALFEGLGEVDLPGSGSQGGPRTQSVVRPAHHHLHQAVSLLHRSQRVHWTRRGAGAAGDGRRAAGVSSVLLPRRRTPQARSLPPGQPSERWTLEQTHGGLQIRAARQQECCCAKPRPQWAGGWVTQSKSTPCIRCRSDKTACTKE